MVGIQVEGSAGTLWVTGDHRILCRRRTGSYGAERTWRQVPPNHFARAREMRKEQTTAERRLWTGLRRLGLGVKFRRQHPIGPYVVDFYSWSGGLVVEVDGESHATPEAQIYDAERDEYFSTLGLDVLRFTNQDISDDLDAVLARIGCALDQVAPSESHDRQWRRADSLRVGDVVYTGPSLRPAGIAQLAREECCEEVYDLEVEGAHSFLTEVCAVHNCGSGTTAYVAEQWGRRWITCDTSRVAVALAKQRLMTARFDYYELARPDEGIGSGFKYKTVPHVTLKSIANNEPPTPETLYDQPYVDNKRVRVTGPFTVEAVPAPVVKPVTDTASESPPADASIARDGATLRHTEWRDELLKSGIRGKGGETISFSRVEPLGGTRYLHADAETKEDVPKRVVVSFGPEHAPLEQRQVEMALEEAHTLMPRPSLLLFAAFQFDPEAAKDVAELKPERVGMTLLTVQMNTDLLTEDLKKKRSSNQGFWLIGQPDVAVRRLTDGPDKGKYQVEIHGFESH